MMILRIGAHVSIGKGLVESLVRAQDMGANCLQIFSSPPQSFVEPKFSDAQCIELKNRAQELNIQPIFIHATYLINLGSDNSDLLNKSIKSLTADLIFASKISSPGVIVHTGSHKGRGFVHALPIVVEAIKQILEQTPVTTKLLLEIASGGGGKIGSTFEELATILNNVNNKRLGVCLDTAHMFAAGFDYSSYEKVTQLTTKIDDTIGWERVACVHVNDSKTDFGSFKDRHENLGVGKIGLEALKILLNSPNINKLPLVLETPGFNDKGPDKRNVEILKALMD
jgi:deoxyribonuclease IV